MPHLKSVAVLTLLALGSCGRLVADLVGETDTTTTTTTEETTTEETETTITTLTPEESYEAIASSIDQMIVCGEPQVAVTAEEVSTLLAQLYSTQPSNVLFEAFLADQVQLHTDLAAQACGVLPDQTGSAEGTTEESATEETP